MEEETLVGGEDEETLDMEWIRKLWLEKKMRKPRTSNRLENSVTVWQPVWGKR
jgi:hypothetical protein